MRSRNNSEQDFVFFLVYTKFSQIKKKCRTQAGQFKRISLSEFNSTWKQHKE